MLQNETGDGGAVKFEECSGSLAACQGAHFFRQKMEV